MRARDRGLGGVQLVISDAHCGLVNAFGTVFQGSSWQRCRVHFMRNVLAKVSKGHPEPDEAHLVCLAEGHLRRQAGSGAGTLTPFVLISAWVACPP